MMAQDRISLTKEARFFGELDLEREELTRVRQAVENEDWAAAKGAWARHLEERISPSWIWTHRDKKAIMDFLETYGDGLASSVQKADRVLRREFAFQGIPLTLEKDILWWSKDYRFQWINVLHRHHYWLDLGRAYWQTGDNRYAEDWVFMMKDWIADNPVQIYVEANPRDRKGQPWRKLETGSRTAVWISAMELFMEAPAFDAEAKFLFTSALLDHAHRLVASSQHFRPGNWHQVGVTGLFNLGVMFPEFKEAENWKKMGVKHLRQVMAKSVHPDGAQSELNPGYHTWMTKSFLHVQLLAEKNGIDLKELSERHEKMFEFLMQVTKPNHQYVSVGDTSSGDVAGIMGIGALTFDRPDMRYLASDKLNPDWIWTFPPEKLLAYSELKSEPPNLGSHLLPDARYGVMRTGWEESDRFLFFDCAPWGGNHCHNDRLQVVLYSGRDLLLDPGKLNYDVPLHHSYFKKSAAHNVVLIDEAEQPLQGDPEVLAWSIAEDHEFASARIVGKGGVAHQRSVLFVKPDYWVVIDHLTAKSKHTYTRLFHFPDVAMVQEGNAVHTQFTDGDNLWVGCADPARLEMRKGHLPKGGNDTIEAPVAAFVSENSISASFVTLLVPFSSQDQIPSLERVDESNEVVSVRLTWTDGRKDQIVIAPSSRDLSLQGGNETGRGLLVREREGHKKQKHILP